MFRIKLTARARRELNQISRLHQESISLVFEEIKENPTIGKSLTRELIGKFTYRVDVYRIIYKIDKKDKIITVISAGHRAKIYT